MRVEITKKPLRCGRSGSHLRFEDLRLLLHLHRCQSNHKEVLNNKDHNKNDNKGEAEDGCVHLAVGISPDYRLIW